MTAEKLGPTRHAPDAVIMPIDDPGGIRLIFSTPH
jgi:hypothetical protein